MHFRIPARQAVKIRAAFTGEISPNISLELKIKNYLNQKEKMISLLNNDDFRKENHLLEQELYNKLSISNKEKELRKEK